MLKDIEGIAFDLDGTLYPNYRFNVKLIPFILKEGRLLSAFGRARNIIRKEQEDPSCAGQMDDFYQRQAVVTAKLLSAPCRKTGHKPRREIPPQLIKEKIDLLIYKGWEPMFKTVKLFKRAPETLTALKKAGFKLGLLSDFPPEIKLDYLGIPGIWDVTLCSERCGALKPHPLPFTELAAAMSLPPEKILYVGNSRSYDVAGANRAGMKTAWIKSALSLKRCKNPAPDFIFSDYRQLHDFMLN